MKKRRKIFLVVSVVFVLALGVLGYGYYVFKDVLFLNNKFKEGTTINGIDVGGLSKQQAQNIVATKMMDYRKEIVINLHHNDKTWT